MLGEQITPPWLDETECVFCRIVHNLTPAQVVAVGYGCWIIEPLGPVAAGHLLVIPVQHVTDWTIDPDVTSRVMYVAAKYADSQRWGPGDVSESNLITSAGAAATQTVKHLHAHIVPRRPGDGLKLPWSP